MSTNYRFAYFGTPYVAADTLKTLLSRGFRPKVVVTAPDAPRGRGLVLTPTETKTVAESAGIPVLTPEKVDEAFCTTLKAYECDYAIVVAYGKILPQPLIDRFPKGVLNIHYSLLPKYRGASPAEAALLRGDIVTGVTIQKMVYELDAGDLVAVREVAIDPSDTTLTLRPKLIAAGADLLAEALPEYLSGSLTLTPQDHSKATRCGKIKKEDGLIELTDEPETLWNKYRAFAEWPGTYFFVEHAGRQMRVKIVDAHYINGAFVIERVIPEGKKEVRYEDFMRQIHASRT